MISGYVLLRAALPLSITLRPVHAENFAQVYVIRS